MNELNSKRMSDDELETVSGGVTSPTVDPAILAAQLMQSQLNAALGVAGGGAYTADMHTPAHTDTGTGTPTITGQTHTTVAASDIFGGGSSTAPDSHSSSTGSVPSGTLNLGVNVQDYFLHTQLPPGAITEQTPTVQPMHLENVQPVFTKVTPVVEAQNLDAPHPGGTYNIADRENIAFNLPRDDKK